MSLQKRHELSHWNPCAVARCNWFRDCKDRVKMKERKEVGVGVIVRRWWLTRCCRGLAMLETVVRFDLVCGKREEEEKCKGARNKYLYLCGGVILPSGASLHPVAAGNHVHRRRRCHTITITDLLTRRDWCTDWSVDG